jgi:hypothetical protein
LSVLVSDVDDQLRVKILWTLNTGQQFVGPYPTGGAQISVKRYLAK